MWYRLLFLPVMTMMQWWNNFFHTRTSSSSSHAAFVLCGRLRICYAILVLIDRYILSYDFDFFFLSGVMPCDQHYNFNSMNSISLKPTSLLCNVVGILPPHWSPHVYYTFFYVGILNAVLLLLGITPKLQLVLLHVNMLSFHFHSGSIWDGEDNMFKIWNFLFLFLPLHRVTIYDNFCRLFYYNSEDRTEVKTWPMWPFRLWQIEICCIYIGAGYTKLSTDLWSSGNALYSIIHTKDFFGGPIVPDFIFNRRGPLHLLTWASLVVECSSIILIWPKYTRHVTLISIILLHLGIDGAMNMHCFEWLSILGWLFFLVERQLADTNTRTVARNDVKETSKPAIAQTSNTNDSAWRRGVINLFLLLVTATFLFDTIPFSQFASMSPNMGGTADAFKNILLTIDDFRTNVAQPKYYEPYMYPLGLYQGTWDLFTGTNDHNYRFETIITYDNGTSIEHWSPDWGSMSWYEKKRWQRPMTFYENFADHGCKNCYATYYAQQYGPNVASVRIISHCEYPELESPGDIFDPEYFFRHAKEPLVHSPPEELFVLNYCDDILDECEEYANGGRCRSRNDKTVWDMAVNCRYSCRMCHNDADSLQVGARIAVYSTTRRQYMDGTVLAVKIIQHIRQYLIQYDILHAKPMWTTSMILRNQGVLIFAASDSELNDVVDYDEEEKSDDESDGDVDESDENQEDVDADDEHREDEEDDLPRHEEL